MDPTPSETRATRHRRTPGRKPRAERIGFVKHVPRGEHYAANPVHVVMRCVPGAPRLRSQLVLAAIGEQLRRAIRRGIAVVQYSIQLDHLHLIVEGPDAKALARGLQWLFSRIALEVNRVARRSGRLFRDRHFRRALTSAVGVRRALVYVMMNARKHSARRGASLVRLYDELDPCSSAPWFEHWHADDRPPDKQISSARAGPLPPPARPSTWLARSGWRRGGGPIRFGEAPAFKLI